MKYYFILTAAGTHGCSSFTSLREIMCPAISVTCGVWEYPYMTMTFGRRKHDPLPSAHWTYKAEHERIKKIGWQKPPIDNNLNSYTDDSEYNLTAVGRSWIYRHDGKP